MMTEQWQAEAAIRRDKYGKTMLKVENLVSKDGSVKSAGFEAHSGEILGIFGLGGSGRTELMECIYGYRTVKSGTVELDGEVMKKRMPGYSIRSGMVLISEDRRGKAMIGNLSIRENITLSCIDDFSKAGIMDQKKARKKVSEQIKALRIKIAGIEQRAKELSGGNQQR